MNVSAKVGRSNGQLQSLAEKLREAVDTMIGGFVAAIDQWIRTIQQLGFGVIVLYRRDVRIVRPKFAAGGAQIRDESIGTTEVQIPHSGGEHDDVTQRQSALENQLPHVKARKFVRLSLWERLRQSVLNAALPGSEAKHHFSFSLELGLGVFEGLGLGESPK